MNAKASMKMPELLVFARLFMVGFVAAETGRAAFYLGSAYASSMTDIAPCAIGAGALAGVALCLIYAIKRGAHLAALQIGRSFRLDLLVSTGVGVWANMLVSPWLAKLHTAIKAADPQWAPAVFILLCAVVLSPLVRQYLLSPKKTISQRYFIADDEIGDQQDDLLKNSEQARSFADAVLAGGAHPGIVFGVDGPWGVGKTSFINLAERHWARVEDKIIVCRFEPLRYASESDLTDRLIRDLSAAIQRKVFAPEFRPAASRYSRLLKGKADISFLGFKLSLEPSQETVDELLDDIDDVLRRIDRRLIIVIDDLDRLDAKTVNNILFATRRTFKLTQANYVLCYDTEVLASSKEEGVRAREFLEKFVTIKLSLFVDSSSIRDFLKRDWQSPENALDSIPSDTMVKLGAVLNELADMLDGEQAAMYLPLVGDLRKVKRFVNAMLLMQIERTNLGRTDFDKRDLINLMLLHLNYPGLFRRIYAEETEGRSGTFSVKSRYEDREFKNTEWFDKLVEDQSVTAGFLLTQLFGVGKLKLGDPRNVEESVFRSRACFNHGESRNLEGFLRLIVRFSAPEPQDTFILYKNAVECLQKNASVASILAGPEFDLKCGDRAHDQFWRVLVNQSHEFTRAVAEDAINALIDNLPKYSAIDSEDRGLRQRSVFSLLRLLDRAGWGRTSGHRLPNTPENVIEIAWRIFGEKSYLQKSLIKRLANEKRGVLGWNDLMIFRLYCCQDRQGQQYNIYSALIVHQDMGARTSGLVSALTIMGMRKISQEIFKLFKKTYIDPGRNFVFEVNNLSGRDLLGEMLNKIDQKISAQDVLNEAVPPLEQRLATARSLVRGFVIYQLSNPFPPNGSGVGCGFYDESGGEDSGGIAKIMNAYMFGVCFNPEVQRDNALLFLDHCLANLSRSFFSDREESEFSANRKELPGGLDPIEMGKYWSQHSRSIRALALENESRMVFTSSYVAFYHHDLYDVFTALDELAADFSTNEASPSSGSE